MPRSDRQRIDDILDAIADVREFTATMRYEDFIQDRKTQSAVLHCIGRIGEAARTLSESTKSACPTIPWIDVVAIRNRVVHEYFRADPALIWKVTTADLAPLETALRSLELND